MSINLGWQEFNSLCHVLFKNYTKYCQYTIDGCLRAKLGIVEAKTDVVGREEE